MALLLACAIGAAVWALAGAREQPVPAPPARPSASAPVAAQAARARLPRAVEVIRARSSRAASPIAVAPAARPAILPIQHPYPARADQLPVSYAPGVVPNPELERRVAERELELRRDNRGTARLRKHGGGHDAAAAAPSGPTQ